MSQQGFDQQLYDDLMREADQALFYRINGLDPQRMYRLNMQAIRQSMAAMAATVCAHGETVTDLFEAGNIAGAFGVLSGAVHGVQVVGIMALTVYLSRHGVETFCKQYLSGSLE